MRGLKHSSGVINRNPNYTKPFTLKQLPIPDGLTIVIDSREQASPLLIDKPPKGLTIVRDCLRDGDYSIRGLENKFCIEKKYHGDLFPYCSGEYKSKTRAKMERFKGIIDNGGWVGLLIDDPESEIFRWQEHTNVNPEVVRGALLSFEVRYGLHVYFARNRDLGSRWIVDRAIKFYNIIHEL